MASGSITDQLDLVAAPLMVVDADGRTILRLNHDAVTLIGVLAVPVLPAATAAVFGDAAAEALVASLAVMAPGSEDLPAECEIACVLDGFDRRLALRPRRLPPPETGFLVTLADRTEVDDARLQLFAWQEEMRTILDCLPVGVEIMDEAMDTVLVNRHSRGMWGYTVEETGRLDDWWAAAYPDPDYREEVRRSWLAGVEEARRTNAEMLPQEWVITCKDGSRKTVQFRFRAVGSALLNVYLDVTRERRLEAMLLEMATTDSLTGLGSRRYFFDQAARCLADPEQLGSLVTVLMFDIDHFKQINDRYGHAVGDRVLIEFARRCREAVRHTDVIGRLGGEEFAAMLPDTGFYEAGDIAERIRAAVSSTPIDFGEGSVVVTVSVGAVTDVAGRLGLDQLLEQADRALYAAKAEGRDRVCYAPRGGEPATAADPACANAEGTGARQSDDPLPNGTLPRRAVLR